MYATDFEYDGQYLSDYGFIICNLGGSSGVDVLNVGSRITFYKSARHSGKKWASNDIKYEECISCTFRICKDPSVNADKMEITSAECRDIMRWLNRREFHKFQFIGGDGDTCYYNASFNIAKITINGTLFALELTMETDSPFGYGQDETFIWECKDTSKPYILVDVSDEIGITYPSIVIEIYEDGNLLLHNEMEDCTVEIKNCKKGEIITIENDLFREIKSSLENHDINNDYNYERFRIGNIISNRMNKITCNLKAKIKFTYTPKIKNFD